MTYTLKRNLQLSARLTSSMRVLSMLLVALFMVACSQSYEDGNSFETEDLSGTSIVIDTRFWEVQCESCHKGDEIKDTASLRNWSSRSEDSLAQYISVAMPYSNPSVCDGECATQTARYMQAVLSNQTIVHSEEQTTDTDAVTEVPVASSSTYETLCAACHVPEKIVIDFAAWKSQSLSELKNYIELTMPFANATLCIDECATETAQYVMTVLDSSDGPDSGDAGTTEPSETVTLPISPSGLVSAYSQASNSIALSWQDNSSNESNFTIWRKLANGSWAAYQSIAANTEAFIDEDISETVMSYRLSASNSAGSSSLTDAVSVDLTPESGSGSSCDAAEYVVGSEYISGQMVSVENRYFECKPGVGAWCSSSADWAYAPITGLYWGDAWTEVDSCTPASNDGDVVTLNAPTILSATVTETSVAIVWLDNAQGEQSYVIEKSVDSGPWNELVTLPANTESYVDSDNLFGSQSQYRLFAKTDATNGAHSTTSQLSFAATSFDANAYYATDCAACHGARGEGTNNGSMQVSGFQSSGLSLQQLADSIEATMPYGNASACIGDCASDVASYIHSEFMGDNTAPISASNVFIGATNDNMAINISWSDNSDNETGFTIEKSVDDGAYIIWQSVGENVTSLTDIDVVLGSTYQYRISAFNDMNVAMAAASSQLLLEQAITLPAKPSNLSVSMNGSTAIVIWADNASNELNHVLQRRQNSGEWGSDILIAANVMTYQDNTVEYGNIYGYRILATNAAGDSSWTNVVELDLSSTINRSAYDANCSSCHRDGGIAIDLLNDFSKQNWVDSDWASFSTKVSTMNTGNCDESCKSNAAQYVWAETWGFELAQDIATHGRGVRGLRLLTSYEYLNTVEDVFGFSIPDQYMPADRHASDFKFAADAHAGVVIYDRLNEFLLLAEYVAENATGASLGCDTSCSTEQLGDLLERAFRRSIDASTINEYLTFQSNYGREDLVASILLSPWFLYRTELGDWDIDQQAYQLNDYEVAASLSYQLWGTVPDNSLLTMASNGLLSTTEQISAQVDVMINDSRSAEHLVEFVRYYTQTQSNLAEKPNLPYNTILDMEAEQASAVIYALTQGSATLDEIFNPGYTFVNSSLASHYGLVGVTGSSMQKITTERNRGGILQQGILQIHNSDFTATSLVKRGKLIRENMMCHEMGVPSNVDPSSIELPAYAITTRERWDAITGPDASEGQCWSCHQLMNEPGSVLENYDAAGRFRTTEAAYKDTNTTLAINSAGVLRSNDSTEILLSYSDARDVSEYLANSPVGQDCFVDNYYRFSTGYDVDNDVQADVDQWAQQFRGSGDIWLMVKQAVNSESFLYRTDRN